MNDFFFHLIQIFFQNYPTPRSQKKGSLIKYGVGGLLLVLIIFIIWFPLVIFSFANTVYISNPPVGVTASIAIGGFQVGYISISQHILMFSELIFSFYGLSKTCKNEKPMVNQTMLPPLDQKFLLEMLIITFILISCHDKLYSKIEDFIGKCSVCN